jgi:hypothetical protein
MSTPTLSGGKLVTSFTAYALTEEELRQGSILSETQRRVIQNLVSAIAEEKLKLLFTPDSPLTFAQEEARLVGNLQAYQNILAQDEYASDPENYTHEPQL